MIRIDANTWRTARRALERAITLHLNDSRVSHIDLGNRILSSANNHLVPELAIRVHVREKLNGKAFEEFSTRHPERVISAERIGFPVDVLQATYRLERSQESAGLAEEISQLHPEIEYGGRAL